MALAKRRSCSASRVQSLCFFFFNDTATTEIYTLSLDDALPIFDFRVHRFQACFGCKRFRCADFCSRSEERFSRNAETDIVCRLLLEKKSSDDRDPRIDPTTQRHVHTHTSKYTQSQQ